MFFLPRDMMKVVVFGNSGWCIYNYRRNLVKRMADQGIDVTVVAPEDEYLARFLDYGVKVQPLAMRAKSLNPFRELYSLVDLYRKLRVLKPSHLCSFTVKCNLYAAICCRFLKIKQIANVSGLGSAFDKRGLLNSVVENLYRHTLGKADRILFQNEEDLEFCVDARLVPRSACRRIPGSGVDLSRFTLTGESESANEDLVYLKRDKRVFLNVWSSGAKKGVF